LNTNDCDVVSFEPIPEAAERLRELSARWPGRFRVVEAALGTEAGTAQLVVNSHSQSSSLHEMLDTHLDAFPDATPSRTVEVKLQTLDEAMAGIELAAPALLKLDVQGSEADVLAGAVNTLGRFDHLVIESSFEPLYEGERTFLDLVQLLGEHGFDFVRPVGALRHPRTGEFLQVDALFCRGRER
jgi:FkbM family methyltransferase